MSLHKIRGNQIKVCFSTNGPRLIHKAKGDSAEIFGILPRHLEVSAYSSGECLAVFALPRSSSAYSSYPEKGDEASSWCSVVSWLELK